MLRGNRYGAGIVLGTIDWKCADEGDACFTVSASMSPETPGWMLCVPQKEKQEKCVCINFVHLPASTPQEIATANSVSASALAEIQLIYGNNLNILSCCPVLRFDAHDSFLSEWAWNKVVEKPFGGHPIPSTSEQIRDFDAWDDRPKMSNRINVYLIFNDGDFVGITHHGEGFSVIDPVKAGASPAPNAYAHELGHALGLDDVDDPTNLMHRQKPAGERLTRNQCETIWKNLDKYRCSAAH